MVLSIPVDNIFPHFAFTFDFKKYGTLVVQDLFRLSSLPFGSKRLGVDFSQTGCAPPKQTQL